VPTKNTEPEISSVTNLSNSEEMSGMGMGVKEIVVGTTLASSNTAVSSEAATLETILPTSLVSYNDMSNCRIPKNSSTLSEDPPTWIELCQRPTIAYNSSAPIPDIDHVGAGLIVSGLAVVQGGGTDMSPPVTGDLFDIVGDNCWKTYSAREGAEDVIVHHTTAMTINDQGEHNCTKTETHNLGIGDRARTMLDTDATRDGGEFDYDDLVEEDTCNEFVFHNTTAFSSANPSSSSQNISPLLLHQQGGSNMQSSSPLNERVVRYPLSWNDEIVDFNDIIELSTAIREREGEVLNETKAEDVSWFFGDDFHPSKHIDSDDWIVDVTLNDLV